MSSWDFNSWDYKTSYTYKGAKEAKRILKNAFYNNKTNNTYQQPFKKTNRRPPGAPPCNPPPSQNVQPFVTPPPPPQQNQSKAYDYSYHYQYKYKGAGNQPPVNQKVNVNQQNSSYQQVNAKKNEAARVAADPNTIIKIQKAVAPYYIVGAFWVMYASLFPIYRWYDFLIAVSLSLFVHFISRKIFKGKKIYIRKEETPITTGDTNVDKIIKNGKEFSKQLSEANLGIQHQTLSLQIKRLEMVCDKIVDFVSENPKKSSDVRKFMNYYMPTTLKLLKYYDKLEEQGVSGENIQTAMKNIEDAMGNIVEAFERQLDSLFADEALDISTDISVLESMLSQEGLLGSDFKKEK